MSKTKEKLYSIVVPIYKVEEYLNECVESLINQTYSNIEIILVDDGSPDNCPKICDDYAKQDKRIKVVHKTNGGLVSARKAGANVAKGDYIICVDGDDYVLTNMVERFNDVMEEHDCDIICCSHFVGKMDECSHFSFDTGYYNKQKLITYIYPYLIEGETGKSFAHSIWAKVYKRDLYLEEQNSLDDKIKIGEDLACTKPIIAKSHSMYILDEPLYFYRINFNSMTKDKKPFPWNGPELINKHLMNRLSNLDYDFKDQIYRNTVHNVFNVAVSQFYIKDKTTKEIKKMIDNEISNNETYLESIKKAKYKKSFLRKFMVFALRKKQYWLLKLYSKTK